MSNQYTLNFDPALAERFPTLREFVAFRAAGVIAKPMKSVAADMDMAPSTLSRKLNPADGDTQRFNLDDLEAWLSSTGDAAAVVEYLAAKYLDTDSRRKQRALLRLESLQRQLAEALAGMKDAE